MKPKNLPTSPVQEEITEILNYTDYDELISLLAQYADKHPDFYQVLVSLFHPKKKTTPRINYAKKIQECFDYSYDEYDFQEGRQTIADDLDCYVEKAKSLIKLNCEEEAITILFHIIKEIGEDYEEYENYDGDLACVCQEAVEIVAGMIETGLPDDLLKKMTDEISKLIKNNSYANYDLVDLEQLLLSISLKTSNFDKGIRILDGVLKNEPDSFRTSSLVMSKIKFLKSAGRKEEVEKVILSYLYLPEIRNVKLKELKSKKRYEEALILIDEGISLAEKKGHSGTIVDWKNKKLSVNQLIGKQRK
jgi:tetratricopeptide (TPR) repeat protein